jgi:hypothetical protein
VLGSVDIDRAALHVGLHDDGVKVQPVPAGRFSQENWTSWGDPDVRVALTVALIEAPGSTEPAAGSKATVKSKGGGGAAATVSRNGAIRETVPFEAWTLTAYVPSGVLGSVSRVSEASHVGLHVGGTNAQEAPLGRFSQPN